MGTKTRNPQNAFLAATLGVLIAGICLVPGLGAAPAPVEVVASTGAVDFVIAEPHSLAELTVRQRGGDVILERLFSASDALTFSLVRDDGTPLADGRYVYDLRLRLAGGNHTSLGGRFEILDGSIVSTETIDVDVDQEIVDVPILGDAIVEGSLCASDSTDCLFDLIILDSEEFDTPGFGNADIKVKDNVPEIWFADSTASDTDFALTVEDGLFFLRDPDADTLPFTLEGGAPDNSVYIDSSGFVGIGTPVPQAPLHVYGPGPFGITAVVKNGTLQIQRGDNTPNIRFLKTNGVPQAWLFQNNTNSGRFAIRDETAAVSPLIMKPGGADETLVLADGRWGLQVLNPAHPIDTNTGARLTAGGVWQNASSRELKTSVAALSSEVAVATLSELEPVTFEYKAAPGEGQVGFIAEDVPELVASADRKGLSAMDVAAVLTRVVQDLQAQVQQQQQALLEQQQRLDAFSCAE